MMVAGDILKLNLDGAYLQRKFQAYRRQTSLVLILAAMMGAAQWFVDCKLDPGAARELLWARLAYLWMLLPAWAILRVRSHVTGALLALASLTLAQLHDITILRLLEGGIATTVMSFVFYPMLLVLLCLGYSLFVNGAGLALLSANPLMLASSGWLAPFPYQLYSMAIWPTAIFMLLICAAFSLGYHQRYLLEMALEQTSNTDPLTGVANRRHFQQGLQQEASRFMRLSQTCALLMIDIDHFKRINDTHGHPTGDRTIQALASICASSSRDVDLVARLGGEEFAVLVPGTGLDGARALAERIRGQVQELTLHSDAGLAFQWTVSIGIANLAPRPAGSPDAAALGEQLMAHADHALYAAKNAGRNRVLEFIQS